METVLATANNLFASKTILYNVFYVGYLIRMLLEDMFFVFTLKHRWVFAPAPPPNVCWN